VSTPERAQSHPPTVEAFITPARIAFADAVRDLADAALTAEDCTDDELRDASATLRTIARALARQSEDAPVRGRRTRVERAAEDYRHRSVVIGSANPLAPGWEWTEDDDALTAWGIFSAAYEGPPGLVHGGWIALVFDEFLGMRNANRHHDALTGSLSVRYRRPTPLHEPVTVTVREIKDSGRTIVNEATLTCGGTVTATAEGVFVRTTIAR